MSEASVVRAVTRLLKTRGAWQVNVHGSVTGRNGIPDILACYRGRMLALELKSSTGALRPLQRHELDKANAAGAIARVIRDVDELRSLLDMIDRHEARERGSAQPSTIT